MSRNKSLVIIGASILVAVWFLFRPEKLFINQTVNEDFPLRTANADDNPAPQVMPLLSGTFRDVAHAGKGTATVLQLSGGKRILRLTDFETSNGPELHLYLVAAPDARDNESVQSAGFVSLGPLKGNVGDQNYELPDGIDLDRHRAVTVWCRRFGVNFTTAPLRQAGSSTNADSSPVLAEGRFQGVAHEGRGVATVYRLDDGRRVLRLTDFETSNGPELHLYMVAAPDARDNETVEKAGFMSLGPLKGNRGDQNYELPDSIDLERYRAATVWCRRFSVNFATAPLQIMSN